MQNASFLCQTHYLDIKALCPAQARILLRMIVYRTEQQLKCFDTLNLRVLQSKLLYKTFILVQKKIQNRSENKKVFNNLKGKLLMEWTVANLYICCGYTKFKDQLQSPVFIVMYILF